MTFQEFIEQVGEAKDDYDIDELAIKWLRSTSKMLGGKQGCVSNKLLDIISEILEIEE